MYKVFYVYLATKPTFISVKVDAINLIPGTKFYNLDLTAIYSGADNLYAELSEEFSIAIRSRSYEVPYMAHLHFENIYRDGSTWVDLELKNKVGKAYYTVEIPKQLNVLLDDSTQIEEKVTNPNIVQVEVRDIQGRFILKTEKYEDVERLPKGIYIIMITYANGENRTKKICK